MSTPSALMASPVLWSVVAAAALGALGLIVGRGTGRLVHLFGPADADVAVSSRPAEHAGPENPPGQDGATPGPGHPEGAPERGSRSPVEGPREDPGPAPPRCPHCRAALRFVRGLPVPVERGILGDGRCPGCGRPIASHLPTVVVTGALFALTVPLLAHQPAGWSPFGAAAVLWLIALGVALCAIDLRVMRLPDALVGPAYPVAGALLAAAVLLPPAGPDLERGAHALIGLVLVAVLYWFLWRIHPRGLGFGDVKLSGLTGLYAGWAAGPLGAMVGVLWAFASFSLVGLALLLLRRVTRSEPLPLGPFMIAATLATVFTGAPLVP
ncbi:prepilin peptidase [Nocardiopsis alba]|uniref:prepilin peptidase n=1 Tax=Nocardiopsis alba TaxID=53437 RepID=UPI000349CC1E|nr:A24 family peptidase [Nocardiopsis alba]